MAYDIFTGKDVQRNWAREGGSEVGVGSWAGDKLKEWVAGKIPWTPVLIVAGITAGLFVIPKIAGKIERQKDARETRRQVEDDWVTEPTVRLERPRRLRGWG